jgi:hypothetical protein
LFSGTNYPAAAEVRILPVWYLWIVVIVLFVVALAVLALKVVKQYEQGVLFRLGRSSASGRPD